MQARGGFRLLGPEIRLASARVRRLAGRRGAGEVTDLRRREVAADQAADEVVAGDDVDARLRRRVEAPREAAEPRVVVGDLTRHPQPHLALPLVVVALDVDLQVAVAARPSLRDQQPLLDPTADDPTPAVN